MKRRGPVVVDGEVGAAVRNSGGSDFASPFGLLAAALAVAVVLDQLWWGGFEVVSRHGVVVLAAFVVLARPSSVFRFVLLATAVVVSVAADLPVVGTHRLLELVVVATVLIHLVVVTLRARHLPTPAAAFAGIAPFLRVSLIVVYAASALAKLNATFLDPVVSCAVPSARGLLGFLGVPGVDSSVLDDPRLAWSAIGGTLLVEATLPVLLAWRRTRLIGVVVGLGFHAVLALAGNVPFSALVMALYVAYLPPDTADRLRGSIAPVLPGRAGRTVSGCVLLALLVGGWLVGAALGPSTHVPGLTAFPSGLAVPALGAVVRWGCALIASGGAAVLLASRWRVPGSVPYPERALRMRSPVLVAGVLVLAIDAACPYVGLKTDTSFEMFSGLRTEPGAWNHLVVPETVRVFGLQDAAVEVLDATDPALRARTASGARLLPFELDRALRAEPGSTAVVRSVADPSPRVVGPSPPGRTIGQWVATFRDLPPPGVPRC